MVHEILKPRLARLFLWKYLPPEVWGDR